MLQKISFLQKLKRWVVREEKQVLCSVGDGEGYDPSSRIVPPSDCFNRSGCHPHSEGDFSSQKSRQASSSTPSVCTSSSERAPLGCSTHSGCFETALSHEVLFKMMVMVLLLCLTIEPAMAASSLGEVLDSSKGYADIFTKTLIIGGTGLGAVQCLRQGNVLLAFGVVVSGALIGLMLGAVKDDSYTSLLG